jgi:tetratricopeptide (TPR) repeat protein
MQVIQAGVRAGKTTRLTLTAARALYDEGFRCLDQAIAAAPGNTRPYLIRAGSPFARLNLDFAESCLRGDPLDPAQWFADIYKEVVVDVRRAAAIAPDDFRVLGDLACVELVAAKVFGKLTSLGDAASLTPEVYNTVHRALDRLRQVAAGDNIRDAVEAAELLGILCCKTKESAIAEECLTRVLRQQPSLEGARDLLTTLVVVRPGHTNEEALAISRERLRLKDSAKNRFVLAKVLYEAQQIDEARQVLEQAIRTEPNDFLCNVGLASLLLLQNSEADLKRAGELLERADAIAKKSSTPDRAQKVLAIAAPRIAYLALTANYDELGSWIHWLESLGWTDTRLDKVKQVLGPRLLLSPPPGIGAAGVPGK